MTDAQSSTEQSPPLQFNLLFRGAVPTKEVRRENNSTTLPAAFEIQPGLKGYFSPDVFIRLEGEGGCRSRERAATGFNYFLTGPSSRLKGLSNHSADDDVAHECLIDLKRLSLGYHSQGRDAERDDDGFHFEFGRLHADDTASRRMKRKGFWAGPFDYSRGDISMPLSWGVLTSYAWSGDQGLDLFKLEGAVMNGGSYGINQDLYGSLRMELILKMGSWKPLLSPYYSALTVAKACDFENTDCVQQGISQSVGLYLDSPVGQHWGFFGATARQWLVEEDAHFINDRISVSYDTGLYFRNPESWQLALGLGHNTERDGDTLLKDTTTEINGGIYVFGHLLLKGGLLVISGDTSYATVYTGIEGRF